MAGERKRKGVGGVGWETEGERKERLGGKHEGENEGGKDAGGESEEWTRVGREDRRESI